MADILPATHLADVGAIADLIATSRILPTYLEGLAAETVRRHAYDLASFQQYLKAIPVHVGAIAEDLGAWRGITWGIVEGFKQWLLQQGFSIGTTNVRLTTVRAYCNLAYQAGILDEPTYRLIATVKLIGQKRGRNIDQARSTEERPTRRGAKKAASVVLSPAHVQALKSVLARDESYIGRRDLLLVCFLVDQGLRCGEVASLARKDINLAAGEFTVYRHKVDKTQLHRMTADTLQAARGYLAIAEGVALFEGYEGKQLTTRAINKRVGELGRLIGISGLSPHDLRHTWATMAARSKTPLDRLRQAGGWASIAMALRYIDEAEVANEGVKLS